MGGIHVHIFEANFIPRAKLSHTEQVGGDYICDFRISARRLLLHKKDNRQTRRWYLNRSQRNAFGEHCPRRTRRKRWTFEPNSHAVGFFTDTISSSTKSAMQRF